MGLADPNARDETDRHRVCAHAHCVPCCVRAESGEARQAEELPANRDHIWLMVLSLLTWCGVLWLEQCACTSECMELGTI